MRTQSHFSHARKTLKFFGAQMHLRDRVSTISDTKCVRNRAKSVICPAPYMLVNIVKLLDLSPSQHQIRPDATRVGHQIRHQILLLRTSLDHNRCPTQISVFHRNIYQVLSRHVEFENFYIRNFLKVKTHNVPEPPCKRDS